MEKSAAESSCKLNSISLDKRVAHSLQSVYISEVVNERLESAQRRRQAEDLASNTTPAFLTSLDRSSVQKLGQLGTEIKSVASAVLSHKIGDFDIQCNSTRLSRDSSRKAMTKLNQKDRDKAVRRLRDDVLDISKRLDAKYYKLHRKLDVNGLFTSEVNCQRAQAICMVELSKRCDMKKLWIQASGNTRSSTREESVSSARDVGVEPSLLQHKARDPKPSSKSTHNGGKAIVNHALPTLGESHGSTLAVEERKESQEEDCVLREKLVGHGALAENFDRGMHLAGLDEPVALRSRSNVPGDSMEEAIVSPLAGKLSDSSADDVKVKALSNSHSSAFLTQAPIAYKYISVGTLELLQKRARDRRCGDRNHQFLTSTCAAPPKQYLDIGSLPDWIRRRFHLVLDAKESEEFDIQPTQPVEAVLESKQSRLELQHQALKDKIKIMLESGQHTLRPSSALSRAVPVNAKSERKQKQSRLAQSQSAPALAVIDERLQSHKNPYTNCDKQGYCREKKHMIGLPKPFLCHPLHSEQRIAKRHDKKSAWIWDTSSASQNIINDSSGLVPPVTASIENAEVRQIEDHANSQCKFLQPIVDPSLLPHNESRQACKSSMQMQLEEVFVKLQIPYTQKLLMLEKCTSIADSSSLQDTIGVWHKAATIIHIREKMRRASTQYKESQTICAEFFIDANEVTYLEQEGMDMALLTEPYSNENFIRWIANVMKQIDVMCEAIRVNLMTCTGDDLTFRGVPYLCS